MRNRTVVILIAVTSIFCGIPIRPAAANEPPPKVLKLLEKLGLRKMLEKQRAEQQRKARERMDQFYADLMRQNPGIPPQYMDRVKEAVEEGMDNVTKAYTVQEALNVYAGVLDRNYPGKEFEKADHDLSTPEGGRLAKTINEAMAETYQFRSARVEVASKREIQEILVRFREAMAEVARKAGTNGAH
jgi:hypothetical protein